MRLGEDNSVRIIPKNQCDKNWSGGVEESILIKSPKNN